MTSIAKRFNAHDLVERYKSGESMKAIANDIGISQSSIGILFKSVGANWQDIGRIKSRYNVSELHRQHIEDGKSILEISKECGASRVTINRWFKDAGFKWRGRSEGALQRFSVASDAEKMRLASFAHEGRRGNKDSIETKTKRAKSFSHRVGLYEREIIEELCARGVDAVGQHPCGIYNLDIFIDKFPVSVEVYSGHPGGSRMSDIRERSKYILNQGISQLTVQVTYPSKIFVLSDVCDKIIAFCEFVSRKKPVIGHHGVVRGNGYIPATSSHDFEGCSRIMSF